MINIRFNNQSTVLDNICSLKDLLQDQHFIGEYFSIALNNQFVSRALYAATMIKEGDIVDIITPMQGG